MNLSPNNQITIAHNVLQCIEVFQGELFLHRHVLYYSPPTQEYIENFVKNLTIVPESSRDLEKLGDISHTCKTFWHLLAYDPQFEPDSFPSYIQRVYLVWPDLALIYLSKTFHRVAILHQLAAQTSFNTTPHELIKSIGAIEAADIVHAHACASKHLPSTQIPLINDYEFKMNRKVAANFQL